MILSLVALSLPPQLSHSGLNGGDSVVVPLDGGHVNHLGKVLGIVADDGKDWLGCLLLDTPGVYTQGQFGSTSCPLCPGIPDAVVLLLLGEGPVVVTGGERDGDKVCFF